MSKVGIFWRILMILWIWPFTFVPELPAQMTLNPHFEQDRRLSYDIVAYELEPAYRHQAADTTFSDPSHRMIVASSRLDREGNARVPTIARYDRPTSTWLPLTSLDEHPFGPMVVIGSYDGLLMIWSDSSEPGLLRTSVISSDGARRDVPVPAGLDGVPTRIYRFAYPDRTLALLAFDEGAAALNLDRSGAPTGPVQDLGNATIDSSLWMIRPDGSSLFIGYDGSTVRVDRQGRVETGSLPRSLPSDPTEGSFYINGPGIVIQRGDTVRWYEDLWDEEAVREVVVRVTYDPRLGVQVHRDSVGYYLIACETSTADYVGVHVHRIRFDSVSGETFDREGVAGAYRYTSNMTAYPSQRWFRFSGRRLDNALRFDVGAIVTASRSMTDGPWRDSVGIRLSIDDAGRLKSYGPSVERPYSIEYSLVETNAGKFRPTRSISDPFLVDSTLLVPIGRLVRRSVSSFLAAGHTRGVPSIRWVGPDSVHVVPLDRFFDSGDTVGTISISILRNPLAETPHHVGPVTTKRTSGIEYQSGGAYGVHRDYIYVHPDPIGQAPRLFVSEQYYVTEYSLYPPRPLLIEAIDDPWRQASRIFIRYVGGLAYRGHPLEAIEIDWLTDTVRRIGGNGHELFDPSSARILMLTNDTALALSPSGHALRIPGSQLITFVGDTTWTTRWIGPISGQRIVRIVDLANGTSDAIIYNVDGSIRHRQSLDRLPDGGIDVHEIPASGDLLIVGSASETVSGDLPVLLLDGYLRELQVGGQPLRSIALFTDAERAIDRRLLLFGDTLVGAYIDSVDRQVYMNAVLLSEFGGLSSVDSEEGSENARRRDRMLHRIDLTSVEVGLNFARIVVGEHCVDTSIIHYDQ